VTRHDLPLFDDAIVGRDLDLSVHRSAIPAGEADALFAALLAEVPWRQNEIVMFGRKSLVPRLEAWIGDPGLHYTYSGITQHPQPWTPAVERVRAHAETVAEGGFNSVLVNRYRSGADGVAWHADDEPELGAEPVIASVSLGATRRFQLRRRDDTSERRELELHHGDIVVMRGRTQRAWLHQVPKTAAAVGERINLTFRTIVV
jgi:alkylated DNA repair dioxygenase AlkB